MTKFRVIDGGLSKKPPKKHVGWTIAGAVTGALIAPVAIGMIPPSVMPYLMGIPFGLVCLSLAYRDKR